MRDGARAGARLAACADHGVEELRAGHFAVAGAAGGAGVAADFGDAGGL